MTMYGIRGLKAQFTADQLRSMSPEKRAEYMPYLVEIVTGKRAKPLNEQAVKSLFMPTRFKQMDMAADASTEQIVAAMERAGIEPEKIELFIAAMGAGETGEDEAGDDYDEAAESEYIGADMDGDSDIGDMPIGDGTANPGEAMPEDELVRTRSRAYYGSAKRVQALLRRGY